MKYIQGNEIERNNIIGLIIIIIAIGIGVLVSILPWEELSEFGLQLSIVFVVGLIWLVSWLRYPKSDFLSPLILYPTVFLAYYTIGSLNISTIRGYVDTKHLLPEVFIGLSGYILGCWLFVHFFSKTTVSTQKIIWPILTTKRIVFVFIFIGYLAMTSILINYGSAIIPGFHSGTGVRFLYSPTIIVISRLAWLGIFVFSSYQLYYQGYLGKGMIFLIIITFVFVSQLGSRSIIFIFGLLLIFTIYYIKHPSRFFLTSLGILLISIVGIIWIMRPSISGLYGTSYIASQISNSEFIINNPIIFLFYRSMREGAALSSRIIESVEPGAWGGKLFVADIITILPGKQPSGGILMAELLGGTGVAGLTSSIIGGLYIDFGRIGIFLIMFVFAWIASYLYSRMKAIRSLSSILIYSVFMVSLLHFTHRGVFSFNYIWDISIVVLTTGFLDSRSIKETTLNVK